jgi:ribosome recycling factor
MVIVKVLKKVDEEHKFAVRNIRRKTIDDIKKLEKDKAITVDDLKKAEKEIQTVTDNQIAKLDEVMANKEKEVMEV